MHGAVYAEACLCEPWLFRKESHVHRRIAPLTTRGGLKLTALGRLDLESVGWLAERDEGSKPRGYGAWDGVVWRLQGGYKSGARFSNSGGKTADAWRRLVPT